MKVEFKKTTYSTEELSIHETHRVCVAYLRGVFDIRDCHLDNGDIIYRVDHGHHRGGIDDTNRGKATPEQRSAFVVLTELYERRPK